MGQHWQHGHGHSFLKPILLSGLGALLALLTLALTLVETLIRPRKRTILDLYTLTPYELGLPGEAVVFAPQQGDYQVSGWYIQEVSFLCQRRIWTEQSVMRLPSRRLLLAAMEVLGDTFYATWPFVTVWGAKRG